MTSNVQRMVELIKQSISLIPTLEPDQQEKYEQLQQEIEAVGQTLTDEEEEEVDRILGVFFETNENTNPG